MSRREFISKYYDTALQVTQGSGIFPLLMLTVAILESSKLVGKEWLPGESELSKTYNNYFGIKAGYTWNGATVNMNTREYNEAGSGYTEASDFRAYDSAEDSFKDFVNFLKTNSRYTDYGVLSASNEETQAERLQSAGYATDPNYSNLLKGMMKVLRTYVPTEGDAGNILVTILISGLSIFALYKLLQ